MGALNVGDLVEVVNFSGFDNPMVIPFIGHVGKITGPSLCYPGKWRVDGTTASDGNQCVFGPENLRRIDPKDDAEPLTDFVPAIQDDWQHIGWSPGKIKERV